MSVFDRPHPEVDIDQYTALSWYLDSRVTRMVAVGARVLDWYSWQAGQIDDHTYLGLINQSDQELRDFRDAHR